MAQFRAPDPQWVPPLPAGFEARWDPNQRAYFFIDHVHHTTTWQDPRFAPGMQTNLAQHQNAAQPQPKKTPEKSLNQRNMHASEGQGHNVAMTTMYKQFGSTTTRDDNSDDDDDEWEDPDFNSLFASASNEPVKVDLVKVQEIKQSFPTASEELIRSLLEKHHNATVKVTNDLFNKGHKRVAVSHPPPKVNDMLQRLHAMFPDADSGLVADMLSASGDDEKSARQLLEEMGYKPTFPATHRNKSALGPRSPSKQSSVSPARSPVRSREQSPVRKQLSDAEKQNRLRQLQNAIPTAEKSVVEMALQVCDYDVERSKAVLQRMVEEPSRPSTSTSRPSTSTRRSPSPTLVVSSTELEPISLFGDTTTGSPSHSSSDTSSRPSTSGFKKSSDSSSRPSTAKSTPKKSTPTRHGQQQRAKQVTHTSGSSGSTVISRQPRSTDVYVSQYRTQPQGPNPTLRAGPNKDLLLSDYTLAKGPNPDLRQGPDSNRVAGSQGAVGPDRSLHCGPQLQLREGPSTENLLVTAI
ncbi:hypothetical protein ACF0H5_022058 [Mactra antiquata]